MLGYCNNVSVYFASIIMLDLVFAAPDDQVRLDA